MWGDYATTLPWRPNRRFIPTILFERRPLADVLSEFTAVRAATVALMRSATAESFAFRLNVGSGSISARALAYLIAGHERHHETLLRERYLPLLPVQR